jgi:hypothetical protein
MKTINEMTPEEYKTMNLIKNMRRADKEKVHQLQTFMNTFMDSKVIICATCSGQIRFAYKRFTLWYNNNIEAIEEAMSKPQDNIKRCSVCEKELKDKRRKKCKECK